MSSYDPNVFTCFAGDETAVLVAATSFLSPHCNLAETPNIVPDDDDDLGDLEGCCSSVRRYASRSNHDYLSMQLTRNRYQELVTLAPPFVVHHVNWAFSQYFYSQHVGTRSLFSSLYSNLKNGYYVLVGKIVEFVVGELVAHLIANKRRRMKHDKN